VNDSLALVDNELLETEEERERRTLPTAYAITLTVTMCQIAQCIPDFGCKSDKERRAGTNGVVCSQCFQQLADYATRYGLGIKDRCIEQLTRCGFAEPLGVYFRLLVLTRGLFTSFCAASATNRRALAKKKLEMLLKPIVNAMAKGSLSEASLDATEAFYRRRLERTEGVEVRVVHAGERRQRDVDDDDGPAAIRRRGQNGDAVEDIENQMRNMPGPGNAASSDDGKPFDAEELAEYVSDDDVANMDE